VNQVRSDLLRLRYFFDGKKLVRRTWKRLDRAPEAEFLDQTVLDNVQTWQVRFLSGGQWFDQWSIEDERSPLALPNAIEVKVSLLDGREFRWLFAGFPSIQASR